ncbi:MAG: helix-turn-helix transcriptional regulator [Candidatus Aerophobetes bacterium]|nr:helix-turn-helix transcriptional regulator [Candidatus Aerophobetes bacterium]
MISPIKKIREEKGLTQTEMAMLLGVSQIAISQWEIGAVVIPKKRIKQITETFRVNPVDLEDELYKFYEARRETLKKKIR